MRTITSNAQAIMEAEAMQGQARAAMERIQVQTEETKEVASMTLEELREQRRQLEFIELHSHSVEAKLNQTERLQNSFDRWSLNLRGKKRAKKEAKVVLAGAKAKSRENSMIRSMDPVVITIKNDNKAPKRPERNKEVLIQFTSANSEDRNPMDEDDMAGLYRIDQNDKELDDMLDLIDASLDGIKNLCLDMNEEVHSQDKNLTSASKTVERANEKQAVAITRVRGNLTGRWLRASRK